MKNSLLILALFAALVATSFWFASPGLPSGVGADHEQAQSDVVGHSFVELPTGTAHYRLEGPEHVPLIILMNGFRTPSFIWNDHISALTDAGFRVLSFDDYGMRLSSAQPGPDTAERTASLLVDLLTHLNITRPVHLVGYSNGGTAAAIFTTNHSEKVRSLTFIASVGQDVSSALATITNLPIQVARSKTDKTASPPAPNGSDDRRFVSFAHIDDITALLISFVEENRISRRSGGIGGKARGPEARRDPADCLCHDRDASL